MLNVLRDNFKNRPYLKWVLILVAFSLTLYLGAFFFDRGDGRGGGPAAEWAARINGETITANDFLIQARNRDAYYRQLFGEQYDQMKSQLQLGQQVMQGMIASAIMSQEARKIGLEASSQEISQAILSDPSFKDAQGNFIGKERYARLIERQYRGGIEAFERRVASELVAQKWRDLVTEPAMVSVEELEQQYRRQNEKTAIDYVLVLTADQELDPKVTEEQLRTWYDDHADLYRNAEGRTISFVVVEREAMLEDVVITDEDITQSYELNKALYSRPEQRRARHILFRAGVDMPETEVESLRRQAEQVLERIRSGEDFAALATSLSQDSATAPAGGDLGYFGRGQMVAPFEEACFNTAAGELAPLVKTEFGFHVIQVTDSRAAGVASLDEVAETIRRSLELRRAQELVEEVASRIGENAETGEQLKTLAAQEGLAVATRTVRAGETLTDLAPSPEFTRSIFALETGSVSQPLSVAKGKAIVTVDELVESTIAPFEEVQTAVRVDLLNQRLRDVAQARAEQALQDGADLRRAARTLDLEIQQSGELAPGDEIPRTGGNSLELQQALFGTDVAIGGRGVVTVPGGSLIYEVTGREPFDPVQFEQARTGLQSQLLQERRSALLQSIINDLLAAYQVEVNQELVARVSG